MRRVLGIVAAVALVLSCAATTKQAARLQVYTEHDAATDFSTWKTFRLASGTPEEVDYQRYPMYEKMVRSALVQQLTERGYVRAEDVETDFRVAFELVFRSSSGREGFESSHGVNTDPTVSAGSASTSTLIVRMLDPGTSAVLWQGRLSGFEVDSVSPEAAFAKAVWRILVEFPPITS